VSLVDAALKAAGWRLTDILVTHHHGDHTHGNHLFRPAAVIGHQRCREQVLAFGHPSWEGIFSPVDFGHLEIEAPFVTFTDLKISLPDYLARMKGLLSDASRLQDAMFECLYFGRNLIVQRRKMLQLTYDVFIYGLAISLVLFIAAVLFGADTHPKV